MSKPLAVLYFSLVAMAVSASPALAGQLANVEYVHNYICQATGGNVSNGVCDTTNNSGISIAIADQSQKNWAANVEYLLAAIDKLNDLSAGSQSTSYRTNALATRQAADVDSVWKAVDTLFNCYDGGYYKDGTISITDGTGTSSCKTCTAGNYCIAGVNDKSKCSDLPKNPNNPTGGKYDSAAGSSASTACTYNAGKRIFVCESVTSDPVPYTGSSWPDIIYSVTAPVGYITINNNTANPSCYRCPTGRYSAGGTATECAVCPQGAYCVPPAAAPKLCSSLAGVNPVGGTFYSPPESADPTQCTYTAPQKTFPNCSSSTSNVMTYTGKAWPASTYSVTANPGYVRNNNNTASPSCELCAAGTFSSGGDTTKCAPCTKNFYCSAAGTSEPESCSNIAASEHSNLQYVTKTTGATKSAHCYPGVLETDYIDGIYSWHANFNESFPQYYDIYTFYTDAYDSGLESNGIYPAYWIQATCSPGSGTFSPANPSAPYFITGNHCWCRLKGRADGVNSSWIHLKEISSDDLNNFFGRCFDFCAYECAGYYK